MIRRILLTVLAMVGVAAGAAPRVSLLTFYPGTDIYELEGHSAIRVVDESGRDLAWNWGTFDFNSPGFVYRFVKGETDYRLSCAPTWPYVEHYARAGRRVVEQVLDLSDEEAWRVDSLIRENAQPENVVYRYNYVLDNCATRPVSVIERAIGDTLVLGAPPTAEATTFREVMEHYHANYPWYQLGIDLALGRGIDRQITAREHIFAPAELVAMMRGARRQDGRPIVRSEVAMVNLPYDGSAAGEPTPWMLHPTLWAWIIAAAVIGVMIWGTCRARRIAVSLLFGVFGLTGLLLTFLIFVSVHEASSPNWLYLWLNPMALLTAVGVWIKSWRRVVKWWQIVNFALVCALALIGLVGIRSMNAAFWPLMLADVWCALTIYRESRCTETGHRGGTR